MRNTRSCPATRFVPHCPRAGRKRPARPRPRGGPDRGPAQRRRSRKPKGVKGLRVRRWRTPFHTFPRNRGQRTEFAAVSSFGVRYGLERRLQPAPLRAARERRNPIEPHDACGSARRLQPAQPAAGGWSRVSPLGSGRGRTLTVSAHGEAGTAGPPGAGRSGRPGRDPGPPPGTRVAARPILR